MLENENFLRRYYSFAIFHFKNFLYESSSCSFNLPGNRLFAKNNLGLNNKALDFPANIAICNFFLHFMNLKDQLSTHN